MNFRNKYLVGTIRTLFGLWVLATGVMGFVMQTPEDLPANLAAAVQGIENLGISKFLAGAEVVAGLLIITNFLPALGALFIAPISVGIIVFHVVKAPETLLGGVIFALMNFYLGYVYWDKFKALFER